MEPVGSNACQKGLLLPYEFEFSSDKPLDDVKRLEEQLLKERDMVTNALSDLSKRTGMPIQQEKGQRRYGPPIGFEGNPPAPGSEVFVGALPRDCYEYELISILERVGPIFEMRLMMNFSGNNRGYCFATYYNPEDAEKAIHELNGFELRQGCKIAIVKCIEKKSLFVDNIPKEKDELEIETEIKKSANGVVKIDVSKAFPNNRNERNRGFLFIEFKTHKQATDFINKANCTKMTMWGNRLNVKWAEPACLSRSITVTNLSSDTSVADLETTFNNITNNGVVKVEKTTSSATVYFETRHKARLAKILMENKPINGSIVKVRMNKLLSNNNMRSNSSNEPLSDGKNEGTKPVSLPFPTEQVLTDNSASNMNQPPLSTNLVPYPWYNSPPFFTNVCVACGHVNILPWSNFAYTVPTGKDF